MKKINNLEKKYYHYCLYGDRFEAVKTAEILRKARKELVDIYYINIFDIWADNVREHEFYPNSHAYCESEIERVIWDVKTEYGLKLPHEFLKQCERIAERIARRDRLQTLKEDIVKSYKHYGLYVNDYAQTGRVEKAKDGMIVFDEWEEEEYDAADFAVSDYHQECADEIRRLVADFEKALGCKVPEGLIKECRQIAINDLTKTDWSSIFSQFYI